MQHRADQASAEKPTVRAKVRTATGLGAVIFAICIVTCFIFTDADQPIAFVAIAAVAPLSLAALVAIGYAATRFEASFAKRSRTLRAVAIATLFANIVACLVAFAFGDRAHAAQICSIVCAAYCLHVTVLVGDDGADQAMPGAPESSSLLLLTRRRLAAAIAPMWIVAVISCGYAVYTWGHVSAPDQIGFANGMAIAATAFTALFTSTARSYAAKRTPLDRWLFERDCIRIIYVAGITALGMAVVGAVPTALLAAAYLLPGLYLHTADPSGLGPVRSTDAAAGPSPEAAGGNPAIVAANGARAASRFAIHPKRRLVIQTAALAVALAATIAFVLSAPVQESLANPGMVVLNMCAAVAPSAVFIAVASIVALHSERPAWKWVVAVATFVVAFIHALSLSSSFLQGQIALGALTAVIAIITFSFGDTVADADELAEKSRTELLARTSDEREALRAKQATRFGYLYELLDVPVAYDIDEVMPLVGKEWNVPLEEALPPDAMIALYDFYLAVEYDWKLDADTTLWLYREMLETHTMFDSLLALELFEKERDFDPEASAESLLRTVLARQCDDERRALMLDAGNDSVVTVVVKTLDLARFRDELEDVLPGWTIIDEGGESR